jgi:hypothetical protein
MSIYCASFVYWNDKFLFNFYLVFLSNFELESSVSFIPEICICPIILFPFLIGYRRFVTVCCNFYFIVKGVVYKNDRYFFSIIFVCLLVYSHTSNCSAIWWLSPLPVTGLPILAYTRRSGPLSREGSIFILPHLLRHGTGLYGLIRKTGTYVPQWDSNPPTQGSIDPDALTTAPRRRLLKEYMRGIR